MFIEALYTIGPVLHWLPSMHLFFCLQLQASFSACVLLLFSYFFFVRTFWLWLRIILRTFFMQLYEIFMQFLLIMLLRQCFLGKCFSIIFKNCFPIFVDVAALYGGLNQIIFLFLFFFLFSCWSAFFSGLISFSYVSLYLNWLSFNAFWYSPDVL